MGSGGRGDSQSGVWNKLKCDARYGNQWYNSNGQVMYTPIKWRYPWPEPTEDTTPNHVDGVPTMSKWSIKYGPVSIFCYGDTELTCEEVLTYLNALDKLIDSWDFPGAKAVLEQIDNGATNDEILNFIRANKAN